jgi:hypothetical protein
MKDQYVGDINDYFKYSILRALGEAVGRLLVCWMRTADDQRRDGRLLDYLQQPQRFRGADPVTFDALARLLAGGNRSLAAVERSGLLAGADFHSELLADDRGAREEYFTRLWRRIPSANLVFFDPDNGLAVPSVGRGRRSSSKYLFWDELEQAIGPRRSVCVYQHFPRVPRAPYVDNRLSRIGQLAPDHRPLALWSRRVAYLVAVAPEHDDALVSATDGILATCSSHLTLRVCSRP